MTPGGALKRKKIIIVDDIPEYTDTLEVYLEGGFEVSKANSLDEAKELFETERIDLAIIDIRLNDDDPDNKDGIKLLKWLYGRETPPSVIMMSAYKEFDYAVEALNAGADYFMQKPINPEELKSVVSQIFPDHEGNAL